MIVKSRSFLGYWDKEKAKNSINEDTKLIDKTNKIFIVADGMGGHPQGDYASWFSAGMIHNLIKKEILPGLRIKNTRYNEEWAKKRFSNAIQETSKALYVIGLDANKYWNMGSTLTASFIFENQIYIGNAGDSSVFIYRNMNLQKIEPLQESVVNDAVDTNKSYYESKIEKIVTNRTNRLSEYIGKEIVNPTTLCSRIQDNDIIILASDGITKYVTEEEIERELKINTPFAFNNIFKIRKNPDMMAEYIAHVKNIDKKEAYEKLKAEKGDNATMIMIKIEYGDIHG